MTVQRIIKNMHQPKQLVDQVEWQQYQEGQRQHAEIAPLYQTDNGQRVALVKFKPGSKAAMHVHLGYETILVLEGSFEDEEGQYGVGDLIINPPNSQHAWQSENGALLYVVWSKKTDNTIKKEL